MKKKKDWDEIIADARKDMKRDISKKHFKSFLGWGLGLGLGALMGIAGAFLLPIPDTTTVGALMAFASIPLMVGSAYFIVENKNQVDAEFADKLKNAEESEERIKRLYFENQQTKEVPLHENEVLFRDEHQDPLQRDEATSFKERVK